MDSREKAALDNYLTTEPESEPDHDFEPIMVCGNCNEYHTDCECDEFVPEEIDECEICGMEEDWTAHG